MKRDLHFEMTYAHPPEHVWQALTNAEALSQWLMPNNFEPIVGHKFQFRTKLAPGFDGIVHCEVLEVMPPERLVYSWKGGGIDTQVIWTLKRVSTGTLVTLDQIGFKGLRGLMVSQILSKGWRSKILPVNLPDLLTRWDGAGPVPTLQAQCSSVKEDRSRP